MLGTYEYIDPHGRKFCFILGGNGERNEYRIYDPETGISTPYDIRADLYDSPTYDLHRQAPRAAILQYAQSIMMTDPNTAMALLREITDSDQRIHDDSLRTQARIARRRADTSREILDITQRGRDHHCGHGYGCSCRCHD